MTNTPHLDAARAKKRNGEPLSDIEVLALEYYYAYPAIQTPSKAEAALKQYERMVKRIAALEIEAAALKQEGEQ